MKRKNRSLGIAPIFLLIYIVSCLCISLWALQQSAGTTASGILSYADTMSIFVGSVLIPVWYCAVRGIIAKQFWQPALLLRFSSKVDYIGYVFKQELISSAIAIILLNSIIVPALFFQADDTIPFSLIGCIAVQILYIATLGLWVRASFILFQNVFWAYTISILFGSLDFISSNVAPYPIYCGWGLALELLYHKLLSAAFFAVIILLIVMFFFVGLINHSELLPKE